MVRRIVDRALADDVSAANDAAYEPLGALRGIVADTDSATFALADAGKTREMNAGTAKVYTIPTNATVAFPVATYINVARIGAGALTVTASAGVTLNGIDGGSVTIDDQYGAATLYKRGTDAWVAPNLTAS